MQIEHIEASPDALPDRYRLFTDRVRAEVVPGAGMCLVSLQVDGREHLAMPLPLGEFMGTERTGGVPLLYPWANRLRGDRYDFDGREVDLSTLEHLKRDGAGLPMHGLLLRYPHWEVEARVAEDVGTVEGTIDWAGDDQLMQAFPFPHRLKVAWSIREDGDAVEATSTLTVEPADEPVPVAGGWHPYLAPPAKNRDEIGLEGPELRRIPSDSQGLPRLDEAGRMDTGPVESLNGSLGTRTYDNLFQAPPRGFRFTVRGDETNMVIAGGEEWRSLQVYAPAGSMFACVEPMFAPTGALSDGRGFLIAQPEHPLRGSFTISVSAR
ncbi:MAG: aldose 1-epimerase [Phycisphaerales bacterium]|nr:aldose 1-epimerase [Phycisphaerales bacterium]